MAIHSSYTALSQAADELLIHHKSCWFVDYSQKWKTNQLPTCVLIFHVNCRAVYCIIFTSVSSIQRQKGVNSVIKYMTECPSQQTIHWIRLQWEEPVPLNVQFIQDLLWNCFCASAMPSLIGNTQPNKEGQRDKNNNWQTWMCLDGNNQYSRILTAGEIKCKM